MTFQHLLYGVSDSIATVTLNNPERMNAFGKAMEQEFRTALENAGADPEVRVIIVTGAGRGFCAGAEMSVLQGATVTGRSRTDEPVPVPAAGIDGNYQHRLSWMLRVPKPIIAAINGALAGIGLSIALYCDFRYMVESAKLTTAFARRGLIAEHGMSWMLPRLIGPMNALDLLMTGRPVTALEAEKLGLLRCLPADGFLTKVYAIAKELAVYSSPRSTAVIKRQVYDALLQSLGEACAIGLEEEIKSFASEDFKEGVAHFMEKRQPAFVGR